MQRETAFRGEPTRRTPWNKVLGYALCGVAAWYAFDPDYPLAWTDPSVSSAIRSDRLAPRTMPVGEDLVFRWSWSGYPRVGGWVVVVLDAAFEEVFRSEATSGSEYEAPAALRGILRSGRRFHWYVVADGRDRPRSGAAAFDAR